MLRYFESVRDALQRQGASETAAMEDVMHDLGMALEAEHELTGVHDQESVSRKRGVVVCMHGPCNICPWHGIF